MSVSDEQFVEAFLSIVQLLHQTEPAQQRVTRQRTMAQEATSNSELVDGRTPTKQQQTQTHRYKNKGNKREKK